MPRKLSSMLQRSHFFCVRVWGCWKDFFVYVVLRAWSFSVVWKTSSVQRKIHLFTAATRREFVVLHNRYHSVTNRQTCLQSNKRENNEPQLIGRFICRKYIFLILMACYSIRHTATQIYGFSPRAVASAHRTIACAGHIYTVRDS